MAADDEPQLTVRTEPDGPGGVVIHLAGELDLATAPQLTSAAAEVLGGGAREVVVDLGALEFMDSSGLRVLLEVANQVDKVRVRNASATARRVIESTGVEAVLSLE